MTMRLLTANALVALVLFLLQEDSTAFTTRSASRSNSRIQSRLYLSNANDDANLIDCDSMNSPEGSSRRRWLGSTAMLAASFAGLSPLPSHAEATLVSSKSVCDSTVSTWSKNGRIIYLLGTAHISETSAELAGNLVKDVNPKGVFIELDPKRVSGTGALAQKFKGDENTPAPPKESKIIVPQISQVPGDGGLTLSSSGETSGSSIGLLASTLPPKKKEGFNPVMQAATAAVGKQLKGLYSRLDSAGFDSGEEFVRAVKEGQKLGSDIVLGDRDVEVTLRRVTEGLAKTDLKTFLSPDSELERTLEEMVPVNAAVGNRLAGETGSDQLTDAEFKEELTSFVETMKTKENVKKIMGQLQRVAPFLYEALVSERDIYMATGLNGLNELETIVAVVGIAHADGIETTLQQNGWQAASPSCPK